MPAASMEMHCSPSSPLSHVPDIPSPLYPDRPIRPMPKRRLRSRLSVEAAESILFTRAPSTPTPLFLFPYHYPNPDRGNDGQNTSTFEHDHDSNDSGRMGRQTSDGELDSEDDEVSIRTRRLHHNPNGYPAHSGSRGNSYEQLARSDISSISIKPPNSTSSSVDGYDSFENTKNKKKRKIPTPGTSNLHPSHLTAELANLGISIDHTADPSLAGDLVHSTGQAHDVLYSPSITGLTGVGLSGTGKGRIGRPQWRNVSVKSPLGVSSDGPNVWANGRAGKVRPKDWVPGAGGKGGGSYTGHLQEVVNGVDTGGALYHRGEKGAAFADPGRVIESVVSVSAKDQENFGFAQQVSLQKPVPAKTQFTFTASSDVAWPGATDSSPNGYIFGSGSAAAALVSRGTPAQARFARSTATHATQTSPNMAGSRQPAQALPPAQFSAGASRPAPQQPPQQPSNANQHAPAQTKKTRPRRTGKEYVLAARHRRLQQEHSNYHHPPTIDEIWICEFCEYESIFGSPPEALVRQYEIKDRKERRRLAEKRRLLEKAKMKGRKAKKGGKQASKSPAANTPNPQAQQGSQTMDPGQGQAGHNEDYLPDDFFEDDQVPAAEFHGLHSGSHVPVPHDPVGYSPGMFGHGGGGTIAGEVGTRVK